MSKTLSNGLPTVIPTIGEVWTSEAPKPRRRSIVREFALNASTHGLLGIARSQSKHNCLFWTIAFLIFTGTMIYFVTETIKSYFEYATTTSVSIVVERTQTFPAVTFCNYAPVRYDRIIETLLNYTNSTNLALINDSSAFTLQQAYALYAYLGYTLGTNKSLDEYFFSIDTMLISCSYNDQTCTADDFISFLSSEHGRCYTFNAKTKNSNGTALRYTNDNGGTGNLQLRLYAQSHLYVPYISDDVSAGIVAMIHDNTELPQIDIAGIYLVPGQRHKLGYKKQTAYFLPSPYTDCTDEIPPVMQAMFNRYGDADYAYSQSICYIICTQTYIYQECGCVSPNEWSAQSVVLPGTDKIIEATLCDQSDTCYLTATVKLSNNTLIWNEFCSNCTQECSTVDFIITPSSASAPSTPYAYMTKSFVESSSVPLPTNWTTNWPSEVQNNYVSLEVVCESMQISNYTQQPSLGVVDVIANVGGNTGLWIGMSFLSLMEIIEMLYRLLRHEYYVIKQIIQNKIRIRQQIIMMN